MTRFQSAVDAGDVLQVSDEQARGVVVEIRESGRARSEPKLICLLPSQIARQLRHGGVPRVEAVAVGHHCPVEHRRSDDGNPSAVALPVIVTRSAV
jgi:hypothetical protein